jgi:hypothetical protein
MVNQSQVAVLESRPVPPDMQCILPQELADAIARFVKVSGLANQITSGAGVTTPLTNNVAQQALTLAQGIQESVNKLITDTPQRRVITIRQNVPAGDSVQPFAISPDMPSGDYEVRIQLYGPEAGAGSYGWKIVTGSATTNTFSVQFNDMPASTSATVIVEELKTIEP